MKNRKQSNPVHALDLAAYILANYTKNKSIFAWRMHKLAYFCQIEQLLEQGIPFFNEKIMATSKGIMIKELYPLHRNELYIGDSSKGNSNHLSLKQTDLIGEILKKYDHKTEKELDMLIQAELPWKKAREQASADHISIEITPKSILEHYKNFSF